jgi:hypothetical protein
MTSDITLPHAPIFISLYKWIYGTTPFPFWFLIHLLWWTNLIHRSGWQQQTNWNNRFNVLIASWTTTFLGREFLAYIVKKESPICREPLSIVLFLIVYVIFEFTPENKASNFVNRFSPLIAFFEGLVQFKLFTICLRILPGGSPLQILVFGLYYSTFDILIEMVLRKIFVFKAEGLVGIKFLGRMIVTFLLYWGLTHKKVISEAFGVIPCAVVFGIIHGIVNGIMVILGSKGKKKLENHSL